MRGESLSPNSEHHTEVLHLVSDVVAAYVSNNSVESSRVSSLIHEVYSTLVNLENAGSFSRMRPDPAVPIEESITDDYITCLEDGKKLKMLKRHLKTAYGMTPDEYRERWGLASDYPMVAPNYAKKRSFLAKTSGLGRGGVRIARPE